jgi:4,5:9,10-diseco-3-hydroxy-5,9,17-trioxoandrosta-1(10),2-diene-4-oate hydrolase
MSNEYDLTSFIKVRDINTRYWEIGVNGSPVVFVHGLSGFIENWKENIPASTKDHYVYALDVVGCGLTHKPSTKYSIE